jgi:diguanylate cyclase (GGDEF)-like protein
MVRALLHSEGFARECDNRIESPGNLKLTPLCCDDKSRIAPAVIWHSLGRADLQYLGKPMSRPRLQNLNPSSKWFAVTEALASEVERVRAEFDLSSRQLESVYAALDNIQSGVLLLDKDLRARYANPAFHLIFNLSLTPAQIVQGEVHFSELRTRPEYAVSPAESDENFAKRLAQIASGDPTPVDMYLGSGRVIRSQCAVLPGGGRMLTYSDVTDIVRNAEELERLATMDGMTGIYNRRHFLILADREWDRSRRYDRPLSFLLIDIDFFKSINDGFGHEAGDRTIVHLAKIARNCKRDSDVLARIGGEEFALLLPETDLTQAQTLAERLRSEVVANPLHAGLDRIAATVSIGVATASEKIIGISELMNAADHALYDAKRAGRNRVVCCTTIGSRNRGEAVVG